MRDSQLSFTRLLTLSVFLASCQFLPGAQEASWSSSPDLPTDLVRATGVYFPANGRFYAMGGRMSDTFGSDMTTPYEYNSKTNTWAFKTAPFPDNQVSNMACGVLNVGRKPYIYCVGGTSAGGATTATKRVFRYDPITDIIQTAGFDAWTENAPDTVPGGFAVVQNKFYILGGLTVGSGATNRIFEFNPANSRGSQWAQKAATLPVALGFVPATAIGNLIFTAGGSTLAPCALLETDNSYVYDPVTDSVSTIAKIPRATGETRALTVGDEMWVLGGGRTVSHRSTEVHIYNPSTGQWRVGSTFSTGQRNFAADTDGIRVFLAGGYNSAEIPLKKTQVHEGAARP